MIVTPPAAPSRTLGGGGSVAWRCLVRRGMLHSETESVDHVRLPAGAAFAPPGTDGVESAWLVLHGSGTFTDHAPSTHALPTEPANTAGRAGSRAVGVGDVVLVPAGGARLVAGPEGLEFLWVAVLPAAVSGALPPRSPVVS
ncbi:MULTISPECIES: cupin domain-containing protein [unclassified Saccharothrix]|uniref:cupin domain-containing protein n=1 Tax=unclassified Saccharothrix TaxID=2593673 RepID=UPI00307F7431